ncbi:hypothetical protein ACWCQS_44780 [Streptomyces sp. NPDC002076]
MRAFAHATAGLPWVLRMRDPVPPDLERRLAELERASPNLTRPAVCRPNRARCDTPVENRCVGRGAGAQ